MIFALSEIRWTQMAETFREKISGYGSSLKLYFFIFFSKNLLPKKQKRTFEGNLGHPPPARRCRPLPYHFGTFRPTMGHRVSSPRHGASLLFSLPPQTDPGEGRNPVLKSKGLFSHIPCPVVSRCRNRYFSLRVFSLVAEEDFTLERSGMNPMESLFQTGPPFPAPRSQGSSFP